MLPAFSHAVKVFLWKHSNIELAACSLSSSQLLPIKVVLPVHLCAISVLEPHRTKTLSNKTSTPSNGGHILGQLLRNTGGKFQLLLCNRALEMGPPANDPLTVNLNPVTRKLVLHQELMQEADLVWEILPPIMSCFTTMFTNLN